MRSSLTDGPFIEETFQLPCQSQLLRTSANEQQMGCSSLPVLQKRVARRSHSGDTLPSQHPSAMIRPVP